MVPLKRTGSCRMMERRERRVCSGSLAMSMPSMMMRPAWRQRHGGGARRSGGSWWCRGQVQPGNVGPTRMQGEAVIAGPPMTSDQTLGLRSPLVAVGTRGAPVTTHLRTCPPCGRRRERRRTSHCLCGHRSQSGERSTYTVSPWGSFWAVQALEVTAALLSWLPDQLLFGLASCSGSGGTSHGDPQASAGCRCPFLGPGCRPCCAWDGAVGELGHRCIVRARGHGRRAWGGSVRFAGMCPP